MTSRALGTGVVLAVTLAAAVVALPAAALPAPAPDPHGPRADFNGDGYPDLAFAAPGATVKGFKGAGYVGVAYGSRNGIKDSAKRVFTQASAGVPGTPEASDAFGSAVASADLDQDGYADLVVGSQGEKIGAAESAGGGVTVLWGGPGGLAGGATLLTGEEYDGLGRWLAVGDFDGDGAPDVVGAGHMALH
ncbi:FG-GAP repeat domain-containing protein, partial [Streptomyces anulatus]|uniref:FG-GAP repeat domain-containing protein n=1 Tax=Streptomyces anulatus TaxID=1892 RepID=UPI0036670463